MPTSPTESPAASDSDSSQKKRPRAEASSGDDDDDDDNDSGLDKPASDEVLRRQIAKLNSYLQANASKKKKSQLGQKDHVVGGKETDSNEHKKKAQVRKGRVDKEDSEDSKTPPVKKKQKVIVYSEKPAAKKPGGLTFKQRKSLHASLTQLTRITEKIVGIARDA